MTKLNDICTLIVDCPHTTAQDEGVGYPLIRTPNIGRGRFLLDGVHRVSESVYNKRNARAIPQDDDIILAREAPAGNVAIIKNGEKYCLGQRTVLIRPNNELVNPDYLTYYLLAPQQQYKLIGGANGATVAHVNLPIIRNMPVELPDLKTQQRIAEVLTAYDELIAVNQRQIGLLEEAAARLYNEYFVRLHFPGYEHTELIDGLPAGWQRQRLIDIADVQYGYAFDGSLFNNDKKGIPIVRIRNIPSGTTNDYTTEEAPEQYIVNNGDILVGMDGEFHINSWQGEKSYLVQRSCNITPKNELMRGWLLQAIYQPIKNFEHAIVGATVAHLGKKHIDTIELLTGPENLYVPFNDLFHQKQILAKQNNLLAEARDRLLPRLLSGELDG